MNCKVFFHIIFLLIPAQWAFLPTTTISHRQLLRSSLTDSLERANYTIIRSLLLDSNKPIDSLDHARVILNKVNAFTGAEAIRNEIASSFYSGLRDRRILRGFASIGVYPFESDNVTQADLERVLATNVTALNGQPASLAPFVISCLIIENVISSSLGIDTFSLTYPATFALAAVDQIAFKGAFFDKFYRILFPEHGKKVIVHEAGHFLTAYLLGLKVIDCATNVWDARKYPEITGGGGATIFVDLALEGNGNRRALSEEELIKLSVVTMGGIAAEVLSYGRAEGGFADEQNLYALLATACPPWKAERARDQARWAVLQAFLLLKEHEDSFQALVLALGSAEPTLGNCVVAIERGLPVVLPSDTRREEMTAKTRAEAVKAMILERYKSKLETAEEYPGEPRQQVDSESFVDIKIKK